MTYEQKPRIKVRQTEGRFEYDYTLYENPSTKDETARDFIYQVDNEGFDFELAIYVVLFLAILSSSMYLFCLKVIA